MGCPVGLPSSQRPGFRLPRDRVLRIQRDFEDIKQNGERFVTRYFIANWRIEPQGTPGKYAVVAGKKLGNAVVRNRAKRLLRETYRLHQHRFPEALTVILIARKAMQGKKLADVEKEFTFFLKKTGLWVSGAES